ncbi:hypothetical protein FK178_06375 [Antarcticibacterium arcticum]|uniref:Lipocalin-like domain-containing protein n=1 Tax=Antarcticibacterium arcticum TaxID=2585771 RepID=A0A5B8YKN5_9FLAO|nr:hypothetical protein [Antarcticibacterium arcticum]QED37367.1 hypothetical protein FK178_06375 [Antarcticibacterium arcticum]
MLTLSCSQNINVSENLEGDWNVFYVIHDDVNHLQNYNNRSLMTGWLKIGKKGLFIIDNLEGVRFEGEITQSSKDSLTIKNANKDFLNGKYLIQLDHKNKEKAILNLNSKNVEIYAEKSTTDFSKFQ